MKLALYLLFPNAATTSAKAEPVDLELILAVDVSRSIDPAEAKLQRDGYIAALTRFPRPRCDKSGFNRRIAVLYLEWAGYGNTKVVVNWMPIANLEDANRFIAQLVRLNSFPPPYVNQRGDRNCRSLFDNNGYEKASGASLTYLGGWPNNMGPMAPVARDAALRKRRNH